MMRTVSPSFAEFSSSCAFSFFVRVIILPYTGWRTRRSIATTTVFVILSLTTVPTRVLRALRAVDVVPALFAPVLEHLREVGEARSASDIEDHFARNFGVEGVTAACEYLADQGLIGKASIAPRLTKRSHVDVQELAFFAVE